MAHELRRAGLKVEQQRAVDAWYESALVGNFAADLWFRTRLSWR